MKKQLLIGLAMAMFLLGTVLNANALTFSDDFEAQSLDPFWTTINQDYGTVSLSSDQVHSGAQSAKFSSTNGVQRNIWLRHKFSDVIKGNVSVWFYDTAPGLQTLYSFLTLYNSTITYPEPGSFFALGVMDHNGSNYFADGMDGQLRTSVPRTLGWHKFEIDINSTGYQMFIDDVLVRSAVGDFGFDTVQLNLSGPGWRPNATYYFDDLSITAEATVSYDVTIELNDTTGKDASVNWDCYNLGGYRDVNYNDVALYTSGCNSWMSGNSLLKFNLDTIPSRAVITSARLILTHWENGIRGSSYHHLCQYMCEWEEDLITYNIFASCPTEPTIASQYMSYYNKDFNQLIPSWLVQGWIDGNIDNYGVSIIHDGWGWHYYRSSEFDDPAERPKLIISYELDTIDVAVDIKPESCPNPFNVKSQGVLPVAILGTEDLDVTEIDITSIRLNGVVPLRSCIEDVSSPVLEKLNECDCISEGPDGTEDLTLKFDTQEIVSAIGTVEDVEGLVLQLTGLLSDGTPIEGSDCISLRPKQKRSSKGK